MRQLKLVSGWNRRKKGREREPPVLSTQTRRIEHIRPIREKKKHIKAPLLVKRMMHLHGEVLPSQPSARPCLAPSIQSAHAALSATTQQRRHQMDLAALPWWNNVQTCTRSAQDRAVGWRSTVVAAALATPPSLGADGFIVCPPEVQFKHPVSTSHLTHCCLMNSWETRTGG